MSQPQYHEDDVQAMSNAELAGELREWANARKYLAARRAHEGKDPLDYKLLLEAADRLEVKDVFAQPLTRQEWRQFPVWSVALGIVLLVGGIAGLVFMLCFR